MADPPIHISSRCYEGRLARRIRHGRKRLGLSFEQAAGQCRLTPGGYSHAELEGTSLTVTTLLDIADGLQLDREWLLFGAPTRSHETPTGWSPWHHLDPEDCASPAYKLILSLSAHQHPLREYLEPPGHSFFQPLSC